MTSPKQSGDWNKNMNKIVNFVGRHDYYYLIGLEYNTYFEKLKIVQRISMQEYVYVADRCILLDNLKIKLCQVKAKDPSLCPNQTFFGPNNIHNGVSGLTCMNIEKFEKEFFHNLDYEKNIWNSYQADQNQITRLQRSITSGSKITLD